MMQPLVSVIMPVWNVEEFVEKSVSSILNQTYENIELIIINDKTPDGSISRINHICSLFPAKNVRIFSHDTNKGLGAARLTGLKKAEGDYVLFVDSDDYMEHDYVDKMINEALKSKADIVISDYFISYANSEVYRRQSFEGSGIELALAVMQGKLQGFLWNKLISRHLFFENNIFPIEGINMWEDVCLICRLTYFAKKISYLPQSFYHYNQTNVNSYSTHKISNQAVNNIFEVVILIEEFYEINKNAIITNKNIESFKLMAKAFCIMRTSKDIRKNIYYYYPEFKWSFFYRKITPFYAYLILFFNLCRVDFMIDWLNGILNIGRGVKLFIMERI